jgi:hypothetical protein
LKVQLQNRIKLDCTATTHTSTSAAVCLTQLLLLLLQVLQVLLVRMLQVSIVSRAGGPLCSSPTPLRHAGESLCRC